MYSWYTKRTEDSRIMPIHLLVIILAAAQELIVLENQALRLEIDPAIATIRCVAPKTGMNWLESLQLPDTEESSGDKVEPSGFSTALILKENQRVIPFRGPAQVLRKSPLSVVLLTPESSDLPLRLQQEIRLIRNTSLIRYTVTALNPGAEPITAALRNTAQLPLNVTIRSNRSDGTLRPLSGANSNNPVVAKVLEYWHIAIPPSPSVGGEASFGDFIPEITIHRGDDVWQRQILTMPESAEDSPEQCSFTCRLDDVRHVYSASLQSEFAVVSVAEPLVFAEEWRLGGR